MKEHNTSERNISTSCMAAFFLFQRKLSFVLLIPQTQHSHGSHLCTECINSAGIGLFHKPVNPVVPSCMTLPSLWLLRSDIILLLLFVLCFSGLYTSFFSWRERLVNAAGNFRFIFWNLRPHIPKLVLQLSQVNSMWQNVYLAVYFFQCL